jgi:molybdopterin synthase sulfur carrier subunit
MARSHDPSDHKRPAQVAAAHRDSCAALPPQRDCYVNVLRDSMAVDSLDSCGIYFGTTGVTQRSVLDALEAAYPMLKGTMREHATQERRKFVRFFAQEEDLSHGAPDAALPDAVVSGAEPFIVIGAMAGG